MMKSQDFASGAINAKVNSNSLRTLVHYLNEKSDSFIPSSNYVVIDAKMSVLQRLAQGREDCNEDLVSSTRLRYSRDIMQIMDKLGLGDSLLRTQLEQQLHKEEERRAKKQLELAAKQRQLADLEQRAAEADKLIALALAADAGAATPVPVAEPAAVAPVAGEAAAVAAPAAEQA